MSESKFTEKYTKKNIHDNMMAEIPFGYSKEAGSVMSDLILANSLIMENFYKNLDEEIKNSFISLADSGDSEEAPNLERLAYEKTFSLRKGKKKASGFLKIISINGVTLPKGSIFLRKDGLKYILVEDVTTTNNSVEYIFIECMEDGEKGNCPTGFITSLESPIAGVAVTNDKPLSNGENKELKEVFRRRIQDYIFLPASSGNKSHYFKWLEEYEENGYTQIGKVRLISHFDSLAYTIKIILTDTNNQPVKDTLLLNVKNYIENLRPEGALITYESAINKEIDISFKMTLNKGIMEDTALTNTEIALNKYFFDLALEESENLINLNSIAGVIMSLGVYKSISELKLNGDVLNVNLLENEVPFLKSLTVVGGLNV
ncbi:MAG: baseplate J/gp47 family protein [Cetobacterium sp.]